MRGTDRWLSPLLRQDVMYRTTRQQPGGAVRACGFMLKPDARATYSNRVMADLVAIYVLRGRGMLEDSHGRESAVEAGCLMILPPGQPHGVIHAPDGQWAEAFVLLSPTAADAMARLGLIDPDRSVLRPGVHRPLVELFVAILHDLKNAPDRRLPRTLTRVHEMLVLAHELEIEAAHSDRGATLIDQACALLSQHLDRRISVPAIASGFDLSYERFRKLFRQRMGLSPGEYRIRRRIDQARTLLSHERRSINQVAYDLGYKDPFTFSKQFKRVVGMSPQAFRMTA